MQVVVRKLSGSIWAPIAKLASSEIPTRSDQQDKAKFWLNFKLSVAAAYSRKTFQASIVDELKTSIV